jgi:hypothetical protein
VRCELRRPRADTAVFWVQVSHSTHDQVGPTGAAVRMQHHSLTALTDHTPAAQGASAWERHQREVDGLRGQLQAERAAMDLQQERLRVSVG